MTFAYGRKKVWIEDLVTDPHPATYDMCAAHAERLAVPMGWDKEDLRVVPPPVTPIRPGIQAVAAEGPEAGASAEATGA